MNLIETCMSMRARKSKCNHKYKRPFEGHNPTTFALSFLYTSYLFPFNFLSDQMKLITILAAATLLKVTLASILHARATCTNIGMNHFFFLFKKRWDVHVLIFFFYFFRGNIPQWLWYHWNISINMLKQWLLLESIDRWQPMVLLSRSYQLLSSHSTRSKCNHFMGELSIHVLSIDNDEQLVSCRFKDRLRCRRAIPDRK